MARRIPISMVLVGAALAAAATLAERPRALAAAPAGDARPRLVLFVSVDQMRSDYLERFRPLFTAGLKRLSEGGAVFTNARDRMARGGARGADVGGAGVGGGERAGPGVRR